MQGLALSREFYAEIAAPILHNELPSYVNQLAVGLVGEGSECFGFDDEYSQDHDWGAGICVWAPEQMAVKLEPLLEPVFARFPSTFKGYPVRMAPKFRNGRVGLFSIEGFYRRFINSSQPLSTWQQWYTVPEYFLAVATNGEVFADPEGEFSAFRQSLLDFYPQDVMKKKLAARFATMAQSGQYNLLRMLKRNDTAAAFLAASRFVESTIGALYLMHGKYMPFYKWAFRGMKDLPDGNLIAGKLSNVLSLNLQQGAGIVATAEAAVEEVCVDMMTLLQKKGLSRSKESWLMAQAEMIQSQIENPQIRNLPVLHGIQCS
ncbi:DUF4037 domain-containing protein [Halodesulfovibrio spirochaetisodalis]|uniref:DUF4037 domain-containing protein n=1 Tax=Halodesulfovibrio spirochaetisodalis TaxID=1560234 RepID=A0A1B7XI79_9BACT|nr:DUF4037 domain-containing protein [Halodesulfovibrio spirochaetisodalis]OBQ55205.1 hypothetical protein SP90_04370 [Halodesulfovibrio spirochaetisodalis]